MQDVERAGKDEREEEAEARKVRVALRTVRTRQHENVAVGQAY